MNASQLYRAMEHAIRSHGYGRSTSDAASPCKQATVEALPGSVFRMNQPQENVVRCRSISLTWATASVLHFFACTEEAGMLSRYSKQADRFVSADGLWRGAYGAAAMPQVDCCAQLLRESERSRRAVVTMPPLGEESDINRPSCWQSLHFLRNCDGALDLMVYQRSLHLRVMPYDCALFCTLLRYVGELAELPMGSIVWCVGSLHKDLGDTTPAHDDRGIRALDLPIDTLRSSAKCLAALRQPEAWDSPFARYLLEEVRT